MTNNRIRILFGCALVALLAIAATASPALAAGRAHAPLGYQLMCLQSPSLPECRGGGTSRVVATANIMDTLKRVNSSVNARIRPQHDGSVDVWAANASTGDCEEYALAKRRALIQAGLPASSLRLAYVKTRSGEGHAVLVVKTARGDLVLDVLTHKIRPLSQSGLRVISMQSANPTYWS